MTRRHAACLAALMLALPVTAGAQAYDPPPGGMADLTGPRPLALGGGTGLVSGNDGILVNPAAVAARKRYSVDTLFATDRRGGSTLGSWLGASVVDGLSGPVAVSFSYVKPMSGMDVGYQLSLGLAASLVEKLYVGAQARWQKMTTTLPGQAPDPMNLVTGDVGLLWEVSELVTLGASGFNVFPTGHEDVLPKSFGAGLAIGSDTSFKLVGDWRVDLDRVKDPVTGKPMSTNRYGVGAEMFLGNMVPLRAGYLRDDTLGGTWWSGGIGLVTQGGASLDLGYKQSFEHPSARVMAASFRVQFLSL